MQNVEKKYLNNFYFKMLVKSAKMTGNLDNFNVFKSVLAEFKEYEIGLIPENLPYVWVANHACNEEWNEVFINLIRNRFINDLKHFLKPYIDRKSIYDNQDLFDHELKERIENYRVMGFVSLITNSYRLNYVRLFYKYD